MAETLSLEKWIDKQLSLLTNLCLSLGEQEPRLFSLSINDKVEVDNKDLKTLEKQLLKIKKVENVRKVSIVGSQSIPYVHAFQQTNLDNSVKVQLFIHKGFLNKKLEPKTGDFESNSILLNTPEIIIFGKWIKKESLNCFSLFPKTLRKHQETSFIQYYNKLKIAEEVNLKIKV